MCACDYTPVLEAVDGLGDVITNAVLAHGHLLADCTQISRVRKPICASIELLSVRNREKESISVD